MPHLSPMSWLLAILSFWAISAFLTSATWWSYNHQFDTESAHHLSDSKQSWTWNLQDGWE